MIEIRAELAQFAPGQDRRTERTVAFFRNITRCLGQCLYRVRDGAPQNDGQKVNCEQDTYSGPNHHSKVESRACVQMLKVRFDQYFPEFFSVHLDRSQHR
jgi:hypothetical protein